MPGTNRSEGSDVPGNAGRVVGRRHTVFSPSTDTRRRRSPSEAGRGIARALCPRPAYRPRGCT
jgi:hypothetical protein